MASALAGDDLARSTSSRRSWASGSFREVWTAPPDVFNRSGRQEEDQEELRWAALERLPTYDRLRKGMLTQVLDNGKVVHDEVDVTNLGMQDKKLLMEGILKVAEQDNEKFLRRLRDRTDRVGIEIPKIEVRYEHVSMEGDVYVGSRALPTLPNVTLNTIEIFLFLFFFHLAPSKKRKIQILKDVSGIVKPSRMTLLLGPPGAGKTTLLHALAGKLDEDLKVSGKVTYCGHEFHEFVPQRTCACISQLDLHHGEMTVRETLDFSGRYLGVGTRYEMLVELSRREKEAGIKPDPEIDAFMKNTALAGQKTSLVTDYILKMLVGPTKALLMDEISTGLDSSATFQICKYMRQMVHIMDVTMVISLLQPAPETFDLFDDIILLSEGQAFGSFHIGQQLAADLSVPYDKSRAHPTALVTEKTEMPVGTVADGGKIFGALFFSLIIVMFNGMAELAMTVFRLPVFYKQRDFLFYHAWAFGLPIWVLRIPLSFMESGIWIILTYNTIGFAPSANRFFRQFLAYIKWHCPSFSSLLQLEEHKLLQIRWPNNDPRFNAPTVASVLLKSRGIDMAVRTSSEIVGALYSASYSASKRGMVFPFQPLSLAFNYVNYYVDMPSCSLVGVSGAGKTTLMDVLAGRKTSGYTEGTINISGYPKNQATFARMFVEEVMELVELKPIRDALVGLPGVDGLSTEQKKRLTIAVELVANPSTIFMDEPTSSLDARAATIVMHTVGNTVDTRRTVVCTIHQPSIDIFEAFDELPLMKRGQVIYAGPLDHHSHKLIEYFEEESGTYQRDKYSNARLQRPLLPNQILLSLNHSMFNANLVSGNNIGLIGVTLNTMPSGSL
ncbi:hypothetical protein SO802_012968 [Lithocarpus litseifolius]|uniref:ABC transporter domain-containing protein n=1 Tax=Lithocarpus litseifolius TaxID=425828 RepID=A0AAW2D496_9ROSI